MQLDLTTLFLVSQIVSVVCGILFALDSRSGKTPSAVWFACAFLCAPAASVFYMIAGSDAGRLWAFSVGNAVATLTVALAWVGARGVNGRSRPYHIALAVPAIVMIVVLVAEPVVGPWTGALPFFLSFSGFCALAAVEFWRGQSGEARLRQSLILTIVCTVNALWYLARSVGLVFLGHDHPAFRSVLGPEISTLLLLVMVVVASFSLVAIGRERALRLAQNLATRDELTGLLNRREFVRRSEETFERLAERDTGSALLLFDLDHFKSVNDTHGHLVGDRVLVDFARLAADRLREGDVLCRYGGEEFAALLPGVTAAEAFAVAESIRADFASREGEIVAGLKPTTSVGIAATKSAKTPLELLLGKADQALYQAKGRGRDRSEIFGGPPGRAEEHPRIVRSRRAG